MRGAYTVACVHQRNHILTHEVRNSLHIYIYISVFYFNLFFIIDQFIYINIREINFACFFVARGRRWAVALLAVGVPEEAWLAPGAAAPYDVGFAVTLAANLSAIVAVTAFGVAVAVEGAAIEFAGDRDQGLLAKA